MVKKMKKLSIIITLVMFLALFSNFSFAAKREFFDQNIKDKTNKSVNSNDKAMQKVYKLLKEYQLAKADKGDRGYYFALGNSFYYGTSGINYDTKDGKSFATTSSGTSIKYGRKFIYEYLYFSSEIGYHGIGLSISDAERDRVNIQDKYGIGINLGIYLNDKWTFYGSAGAGLLNYEILFYNKETTSPITKDSSVRETGYEEYYSFGGGFNYKVAKNLSFGFDYSNTISFVKSEFEVQLRDNKQGIVEYDLNIHAFTFSLGILF